MERNYWGPNKIKVRRKSYVLYLLTKNNETDNQPIIDLITFGRAAYYVVLLPQQWQQKFTAMVQGTSPVFSPKFDVLLIHK